MPLLVYPRQMIAPAVAIVGPEASATKDLYYLLLALFNRTGQGNGAPIIAVGLTALVPGASPLPIIAADWNEFSTVPAGGACQIPLVAVGSDFIVWNFGANVLAVTPQAQQQIDTGGAGRAYNLAAGKMQWFRCTALNQLRSMQLG